MEPVLSSAAMAAIPFATCPVPGIATAGQPPAPSWAELARTGWRTVLDLRAPEEPRGHDEAVAVRAAGLEYVALPVTQATLADDSFRAFRDLVRDPARRPIFVHCATSNRVGAMLIPYFMLDEHRDRADALRLATTAGLRSPELAALAFDYVRRNS